jgi:hypothetical protein
MVNRAWKEVRELGEKIGYGELMTLASIIWAAKLGDSGFPDNGAFYPTALFNMKDSQTTKDEVEYRKAWVEFYKAHFGGKEDVK